MSGQTFRAPIRGNDPAKTSFYSRHSFGRLLHPTFSTIVKENASISLQRLLWETGVWADGLYPLEGNVRYNWIKKPIEITPTEISIRIRDDATWSDGQQITGKDIACIPIQESLRNRFPPYYLNDKTNEPANLYAAFGDFDIREKSVTYGSSPGHFDSFWDIHIQKRLGTFFGPHLLPTHVEPYAAYADAVTETAKRAQAGEINPWKGHDDPGIKPDAPHKESLVKNHLAHRKYIEKFSKPENVLATGAWNLVEFRGSEAFVFETNPHHRHADAINFERAIFEYTPSARRMHASLKADRLDYGTGVTPNSVVESLPDNITQLLAPGGLYTGNELALNFDHPALGNHKVRMAIMYVLDHKAIANNIHPSTAKPVTTPGGDCWKVTDYVSQTWIDENLTTYTTDSMQASSLMREAGYTKEDERWVGEDGTPITLTLATTNQTPRWEPTVASQLSEFGIQTSVKTLDERTFQVRTDNGKFPMWSSSINSTTNLAPATLFIWLLAAERHQKYGIYPDDQFESGTFSDSGAPRPRTEQRWREFTVKAPPIGQPSGSLKEYHPASLSLAFYSNPPEVEFRRRVKTGLWLANWFLPTIPINKTLEQHFIDDAHWRWPKKTPSWKNFTGGGPRSSYGIFASGHIRANADNPEEGASSGGR